MENLYSLSGAALQSIHVINSSPPSATQPCTSKWCNLPNFFINNLHVHNAVLLNDDRHGGSLKRGQLPFFAQNSLYRNKCTTFMSS